MGFSRFLVRAQMWGRGIRPMQSPTRGPPRAPVHPRTAFISSLLLTCVPGPLAERVEGGLGLAGPAGAAGAAGRHRLAQVVRADFLGVVGGCFTPVCNTATASQQAPPPQYNMECFLIGIIWNRCSDLVSEQTQLFQDRNI